MKRLYAFLGSTRHEIMFDVADTDAVLMRGRGAKGTVTTVGPTLLRDSNIILKQFPVGTPFRVYGANCGGDHCYCAIRVFPATGEITTLERAFAEQ